METDIPLKILFRLRAADLLVLTGDQSAEVLSTDVVEIQHLRRTVDFVYKLRLGEETYFRHLEFQASADPDMPERCFRYNSQMILQYRVPVLTTVIYLSPQAAIQEPVYRVVLAGREINRWQFESLRLWELEAQAALEQGLPGVLALVPMMKGADLAAIEAASRQIEAAVPAAQRMDLLAILHILAEGRYTAKQLRQIIGKERYMQSVIITEAQLEAQRRMCRAMVRKYHPALMENVETAIEQCTDEKLLEELVLNATEMSDEEFAERLGATPSS